MAGLSLRRVDSVKAPVAPRSGPDTEPILESPLAVSGEVYRPMYEFYLTAFRNGVTDIDVEVDEETLIEDSSGTEMELDGEALTVTVTFAVTTDSVAWITIDGDGYVYPSFGGTGTPKHELDGYAEQAVEIWRGVTGDTETTCRYKLRSDDDRDEDDPGNIIDA